jgi:hypothetical protein
MSRIFALLVCGFAVSALAGDKPRISMGAFKGPKAAQAKTALSKQLCKTFVCVKPGADSDTPVDAVVTAEVSKTKLEVSVYFDEDKEPVTRELKLKAGKLPATAGKSVASAVREAVASGVDPEDAATAMASGSP